MTRPFVNFSQHVSCPRRWVCESKIFEQRERDIIVSISLKSRKIDFPFATYAHGSIIFNLITCNLLYDLYNFI